MSAIETGFVMMTEEGTFVSASLTSSHSPNATYSARAVSDLSNATVFRESEIEAAKSEFNWKNPNRIDALNPVVMVRAQSETARTVTLINEVQEQA